MLTFAGAAAIVWWSGVRLSNTTDLLDRRLGLGDALGGIVLLALVTNLPDIAIVSSAALSGHVGLATGSLLGGVAVQTLVLAIMDAVGGGSGVPLTSRTRSLIPAIEAILVIVALALIIIGSQVDPVMSFRIEPVPLVILLAWIGGLALVSNAGKGLAWKPNDDRDRQQSDQSNAKSKDSTGNTVAKFLAMAVLTLIGGVMLERSGDAIATEFGIGSVVFGATFLAAATAIPDISTGVQAVKLGDNQLAISDVFGANGFLPSLFLLAGLLSGTAVLARTSATNIYMAALGMILMSVYLIGLLFRSDKRVFRLGMDSVCVIVIYCVGILGLLFMV